MLSYYVFSSVPKVTFESFSGVPLHALGSNPAGGLGFSHALRTPCWSTWCFCHAHNFVLCLII